MKSELEDKEYQKNSLFWTQKKDELTLVGDYLGRLPSVELLSPKKGEVILDAGCGAGLVTRMIARKGAKVFACDRNKKMLDAAILHESKKPLNINYDFLDITSLKYTENFFDKISCVAVLIHNSPNDCLKFFKEANRTLKKNGKILISVTHPHLFHKKSPVRQKNVTWARYQTIDNKPMTSSQRFKEDYYSPKKEVFSSIVWYHPKNVLLNLLTKSNFEIISCHEQYMTKEILVKTNHTGKTGHPCFLQIIARKK